MGWRPKPLGSSVAGDRATYMSQRRLAIKHWRACQGVANFTGRVSDNGEKLFTRAAFSKEVCHGLVAAGLHNAVRLAQRARVKWQAWLAAQTPAVRASLHDLDWDKPHHRPNKRGLWYTCRQCGCEQVTSTFCRATCSAVPAAHRLSYLELAVQTGNKYLEGKALAFRAGGMTKGLPKTKEQAARKSATQKIFWTARKAARAAAAAAAGS